MEFSKPEYWSGEPFPSPGDLPNPGIEHRSPTLVDFLPAEPQGKPKNIEVDSLSLLQWIFPTQVWNQGFRGLLHCRRILYQLNYQSGEGSGTPLHYSCLENPMDGGAWWAAVHGVAKSRTRLRDFSFTFHFHALEKEMATHSTILAWRIPGKG